MAGFKEHAFDHVLDVAWVYLRGGASLGKKEGHYAREFSGDFAVPVANGLRGLEDGIGHPFGVEGLFRAVEPLYT